MGNLSDVKDKFSYLKEGEVVLLENIRFNKEEGENDQVICKNIILSM